MANSIITPEYIEFAVYNVLSSFPDLSGKIHDKDNTIKDQVLEPDNNPEDKEERALFFRMWLTEQFKRYDKVYNSIERHFKNRGFILPPEPIDFMKWFVKLARKSQDYLTVKIEDVHFILYHEERLKKLHKTNRWEDLYKELTDNGYIWATPEVFNLVMEYKQLPGGNEKILWRTVKADAIAFQRGFQFEMKQFNKCFRSNDERPFSLGSVSKVNREEPLRSIIDKYKSQLEKQ
jgi:hypothetical protein